MTRPSVTCTILLLASALKLALPSGALAAEYKVDPNHSSVGFSVRRLISPLDRPVPELAGSTM